MAQACTNEAGASGYSRGSTRSACPCGSSLMSWIKRPSRVRQSQTQTMFQYGTQRVSGDAWRQSKTAVIKRKKRALKAPACLGIYPFE